MPPMRNKTPIAHLRAMRGARTHGFGDHTHCNALKLRQISRLKAAPFEPSIATLVASIFALNELLDSNTDVPPID